MFVLFFIAAYPLFAGIENADVSAKFPVAMVPSTLLGKFVPMDNGTARTPSRQLHKRQ